jgi:hypothetical protein
MPRADRLTVGIMAMIAEKELRMNSERTNAALAAAKRRAVKLEGYRANAGLTAKARKAGHAATSLRTFADGLDARGIPMRLTALAFGLATPAIAAAAGSAGGRPEKIRGVREGLNFSRRYRNSIICRIRKIDVQALTPMIGHDPGMGTIRGLTMRLTWRDRTIRLSSTAVVNPIKMDRSGGRVVKDNIRFLRPLLRP